MTGWHSRRFTQEIGLSPAAFVAAARLDHAKRLLVTTEMAVASIAYASGYGSAEAMNLVFRSRLGVTPTDLRNRLQSIFAEPAGAAAAAGRPTGPQVFGSDNR